MKKYLIALISIILTGTVVASTTYYVLDQKAKKDIAPLKDQISDLNDRISSLNQRIEDTNTKTNTLNEANESTNWKTYQNSEYGFSFQYPNTFPDPVIDTPNIVAGSNIKKHLTLSFENLTPSSAPSVSRISLTAKEYDLNNPIENLEYEGMTGQVNHTAKRESISSRDDGIETSQRNDGTKIVDTPIQIRTIDKQKIDIFHFNFTPTNTYSKVAEIYYGADKFIEFSAGKENATPTQEFVKNPFTTLSTGSADLDTLFLYFDQILPTFRFTQ